MPRARFSLSRGTGGDARGGDIDATRHRVFPRSAGKDLRPAPDAGRSQGVLGVAGGRRARLRPRRRQADGQRRGYGAARNHSKRRRQRRRADSRIRSEIEKRKEVSAGCVLLTMIPPTEIAGQKLNREQTAYLEGLFAGLKNRGLTFPDVAANPAGDASGTAAREKNLDSLIFEERVKQELHPLDSYPLLLEHAAASQTPDKENTFRFKWHGLFYLAPGKEACSRSNG